MAASVAVFYISTFIDLSDKLFKGASWFTLGAYFWYATPQFAYYILPISVLIATLVTIGMLTKNSEIIVMKACGVSLYRVAMPMLTCATVVGGMLFLLDATVLGAANRRAETLKDLMKGAPAIRPFQQPWVVGHDGTIYYLERIRSAPRSGRARRCLRVRRRACGGWSGEPSPRARSTSEAAADHSPSTWRLENGWTRTFDATGNIRDLSEFAASAKELEAASYFSQEPPDARFMSYAELRGHTERLRSGGFDVLGQQVALSRKVAFPFVTVIMTLIAIPFAVTIGRSGTMAGIAVGDRALRSCTGE